MNIEARLIRAQGALTTPSHGRQVWNADVAKALGSNDLAPDPHDLLDSALAACTALTLELYLRRQAWPAASLQVKIDHTETRDTAGRVVYQLQGEIAVAGDLTEDQRARSLELAGKCPIHCVLEGQVSISTRPR